MACLLVAAGAHPECDINTVTVEAVVTARKPHIRGRRHDHGGIRRHAIRFRHKQLWLPADLVRQSVLRQPALPEAAHCDGAHFKRDPFFAHDQGMAFNTFVCFDAENPKYWGPNSWAVCWRADGRYYWHW